jgi:hypothetical protein
MLKDVDVSWDGRLARVLNARARRPCHELSRALTIFVALLLTAGAFGSEKKLIEFGWDEPDTAFMRAHVAEMEKMPFDGTVFTVHANSDVAKKSDFLGEGWGKKAFAPEEFTGAIDDLKTTKFTKFTHNFARFDVTPGNVDWFDDFSAITNNAAQIARVAKLGGCKGVLFDIEQYASPLWTYVKQRDAGKKPFAVYAAKARIRGHEVMDAFQREYPGITIFLTFGYSLPWEEMRVKNDKLADVKYGLMAPFLNGMVEAAEGETKIIDGFEVSYGWREEKEFDDGYNETKKGVLPIVADPEKYSRVISAGFGLWMDFDWRKIAWATKDFSKNHFTPEQFEKSVRAALARSDEYVWIYTEKPWWWGPNGSKDLPDPYISAVRRAREH